MALGVMYGAVSCHFKVVQACCCNKGTAKLFFYIHVLVPLLFLLYCNNGIHDHGTFYTCGLGDDF